MPVRSWRFSTEPYYDFELIVDTDHEQVLLKEWYDAGKDPGVTAWPLSEFSLKQLPIWPGRRQLLAELEGFLAE